MLHLFLQLLLGVGVGIYGYLTPGYINLKVLQLSVHHQQKKLLHIILLIAFIEIPYCFLCMSSMQWLMQQHLIMKIIGWLLVLFLFLMAIFILIDSKKASKKIIIEAKELANHQYKKLFFFVLFNPFQISAWAIWGAYFIEKSWFDWSLFSIFIFSIGACLGVLIILLLYAFIGKKIITFFELEKKYIEYFVAAILIVLAITQLVRNLK